MEDKVNTLPGGQRVIDYMARDYDSLLAALRALVPQLLPEWTDYESDADVGNALLQLFAHMGDIQSYYLDRVANEAFLSTAQTRRAVMQHLRLIGYQLSTAAPASTTLDIQFPAGFDQQVVIRRGDAFSTKSTPDRPSVRFEYVAEEDLTIDGTTLPDTKRYAGLPVEEGRLIRSERLGVSDGTADQVFELGRRPVILRSLGEASRINRDIILTTTTLGTEVISWVRRETLAYSRDNQTDFTVEVDEEDRAFVRFGDGAFGAIPPIGAEVFVDYRIGGGVQGNVPADSVQTVAESPALSLAGATVTNPKAATGGAARESTANAVDQAPQIFRSLKRAVTADDYKALALQMPGVGKVRAVATNWNLVTLSVAPSGGGQVSDVLEANLRAYFEDKRMISTQIDVVSAKEVPIVISATLGVVSFYSEASVEDQVRSAVAQLLAFDNVDFANTLYLSKFFEAIEAIDGVKFVDLTEFRRADQAAALGVQAKLNMGDDEIPLLAPEGMTITTDRGGDD